MVGSLVHVWKCRGGEILRPRSRLLSHSSFLFSINKLDSLPRIKVRGVSEQASGGWGWRGSGLRSKVSLSLSLGRFEGT